MKRQWWLGTAAAVLFGTATGALAQAPKWGTVNPAQASVAPGVSQPLTFTASYAPTAQPDLFVEITPGGSFNAGCWLVAQYNGGQPLLSLHDGYTGALSGPVSFGGNPLSTQFCTVSSSSNGFSFDGQGNLTVAVSVNFTSLMAGQSLAYLEDAIDDATNASSGWLALPGEYLTLTTGSLGPPTLGTLTLSSQSVPPGQPMTLQITPTDPNGWSYVDEAWVLVSPNHDAQYACEVIVIPDQSAMLLVSNDQSYWTLVSFGSGSASNDQCTLNGQGSTLSYNGPTVSSSTNVTITMNLQFTASLRGLNFVDEYVWDSAWGTTAGWGTLGQLTVAAPPIITTDALLSPGILSMAYKQTVTAQGGSGQYSWSAVGLPAGLSIDGNGSVTGTPLASGTFSPTVTVTDSASQSAKLSGTLLVAAQGATHTPHIPVSNPIVFPPGASKAGVFRPTGNPLIYSFLQDSNGDGSYGAVVDRYIANFLPGGTLPGDVPVTGDWNGDGVTKIGIFRPSTGMWWLDANNNGVLDAGDFTYQFGGLLNNGVPVDLPVVGDWTGNSGRDCIGVYRTVGSEWILDLNCNGIFENTPTDAFFPFGGLPGDVPVVGKWTGAGTRAGVVRKYAPGGVPQGNPFFWVPDAGPGNAGNAPANHPPDTTHAFAFGGLDGDKFVTGEWNANGVSAAGVYRNGFWVLDNAMPGEPLQNHVAGKTFGFGGLPVDVPVTGKWAPPSYYNLMSPGQSTCSLPAGSASQRTCPSFSVPVTIYDGNPVTVSFSVPNGVSISRPTCTGSCSVNSGSVTCNSSSCTISASAVVYSNTAPSAVFGDPGSPYNIQIFASSVHSQWTNVLDGELSVYVPMTSSTGNLSLGPNIGPFNLGTYYGPAQAAFPSCPSTYSTAQGCMRAALANYSQTQGVTSVTAHISVCDSDFGPGILTNCSGGARTVARNDSSILAFGDFMSDLAIYGGIHKFGMRPVIIDAAVNGAKMGTAKLGCTLNDVQQLWYVPTVPFPMVFQGRDASGNRIWGLAHDNQGYDCVNPNGVNFIGWDNILMAFDQMFKKMCSAGGGAPPNCVNGVQLDYLDLMGEVDLTGDGGQLTAGDTVAMRLIFDPYNSYSQPLPLCPRTQATFSQTGLLPNDILSALRCYAEADGMVNPFAIHMSGQNEATTVPGFDCPTIDGLGSARIYDNEQFLMALTQLNGNGFGHPVGVNTVGTLIGGQRGMMCPTAGTNVLPDSNIPQTFLHITYSQLPTTADLHAYVCLVDSGNFPSCASASTQAISGPTVPPIGDPNPLPIAYTRTESQVLFNDLAQMLNSFYPTSPPQIIVGESHSPVSLSQPYDTGQRNANGEIFIPAGYTCENNPGADPREEFVGIRQSSINGYAGGASVRPFNVSGSSCYSLPALLTTYGYDLFQQ